MAERGFLGSARVVGACTITSHALGIIRDILCASYFGASAEWDAFVIAFIIPNLFRRLFGEGALTAAFVPVFVDRFTNQGRESANRLLRSLMASLSLILLLLVLVGIGLTFFLPYVSASPKLLLICQYLRVMLPYLFLICTAAILGAALNSLDHFFFPAFAPVMLNVVWITALLVVSISICCCQTHLLLHGLSDTDDRLSAAAASPCCDRCAGEEADPPETPSPSPKGCQVCCIKGTGLKDHGAMLPPGPMLMAPIPALLQVLASSCRTLPLSDCRGQIVEPRTLLSMHCALVV